MSVFTDYVRFLGVVGSSEDVAQMGLTLVLGRDVNWKSIGASVDLIRDDMAQIHSRSSA